ncbi:hypothetical protein PR202_ga30108 [Eleusine coracana subsp. coracana]|uniref:protein-serine/threonine phosphatase n=1 Tax=Eleusine coracana subsp. coracana TaxID=191504 RepID=A0AAV5DMJ4_ELECO|nr:hypothetical protein PR202_ga30108 [Eleusine coracana subsp. coracana]
MVAVAAGRRAGAVGGGGGGRRRAGCGGQAAQQQQAQAQLLAVAVAAAGTAEAAGGANNCCVEFLECLLSALGVTAAAAPAPAQYRWAIRSIRRRRRGGGSSSVSSPRGAASAEGRGGAPGRIAGNGASASAAASLYTLQGKKGVNQDAMVLWEVNFCFHQFQPIAATAALPEVDSDTLKRGNTFALIWRVMPLFNLQNFGSKDGTIFCGVFDGHGPNGHLVAKRVRDLLPLKLIANLGRDDYKETSTSTIISAMPKGSTTQHGNEDTDAAHGNEENGEYPQIFTAMRASFLKAFYVMDRELKMHKNIDCAFSGTTAVTVIKQNFFVLLAGIKKIKLFTGEAQRIRQRRGRIFSLPDEPNVARVWLPTFNSPGLAMARSFGDFCLKNYGVISMPDVFYHHITEKDEFVVLATDGVWDVLSNAEVVSIVSKAPSQASAARFLVESAQLAWRTLYPTSKTDDCAAVCLFLNTETTSTSSSSGTKVLACDAESSNTKHSLTVKSSSGVPSNLLTALVTDDQWSILDRISGPVTVPALPKLSSITKESIKK